MSTGSSKPRKVYSAAAAPDDDELPPSWNMEFVTVKYTVNEKIGGENYLPAPVNVVLSAFETLQPASMTNDFFNRNCWNL